MLVVVFIFTLMALTTTAILVRAMAIERRSFSAQTIQGNILAVAELMAKEIRVSRIVDQDNSCSPATSTLVITHPIEGAITYSLSGGVVQRITGGTTYLLSTSEVVFNSLGFCISGTTSPSDDQPARVTILMSVSNRIGREILTNTIQTTVTSRNVLDELQN